MPRILAILGSVWIALALDAPGDEIAETRDGRPIEGRLEGDAERGFTFAPKAGGGPLRLETLRRVTFPAQRWDRSVSAPPFQVSLGQLGVISGRLGAVTPDSVQLESIADGQPWTIQRRGARALVQKPGEALVWMEGFEALDASRWSLAGKPRIETAMRREGKSALALPAGGSAVVARLETPITSGRLDLLFLGSPAQVAGQTAFVELIFQGATNPESIVALLGWEEETLAIKTRGLGLAVQPLRRQPGWHTLSIRFQPGRADLGVDGDELAYGEGPGGPLVEVRLGTEASKGEPPERLEQLVDDLRLVRYATPSGTFEVDPTQDEARLVSGDQIFGTITEAGPNGIVLQLDDRRTALSWAEVGGLYFRREPAPAEPVSGLWVRAYWASGRGSSAVDLDSLEGAIESVSATSVVLNAPYAGRLALPRDRLARLEVLGAMTRQVLDATSHHLGNSVVPDLVPPQPGGTVLETTFTLPSLPRGPAALVLDVVQVVGVEGDLDFSPRVRAGELVTTARINGEAFDNLNRHVTTRNDSPLRVRLPIPAGRLRVGKNVLRLEQTGTKEAPETTDNLGVLAIALEFTLD